MGLTEDYITLSLLSPEAVIQLAPTENTAAM